MTGRVDVEETRRRRQQSQDTMIRELVQLEPVRAFLIAYGHLWLDEDPLRGRSMEPSRPSEFDRPLPYQATQRTRRMRERVDTGLRTVTDAMIAWFDPDVDAAPIHEVCPSCGRHDSRRSKVRLARDWLEEQLVEPAEVAELLARAAAAGHSQRSVERASHWQPRVKKQRVDGRWVWSWQ